MRILLAPDKFAGSLSASGVAAAMERGAARAVPAATVIAKPLADGGEGTVEVLVRGAGARAGAVAVTGPGGMPAVASVALGGDEVIVEMATTSGWAALAGRPRPDPLTASTEGAGEALARAAAEANDARLILAIGGSVTTDGGTGAARATGWRFLDRLGHDLPPGGGPLRGLARIVRPTTPGVGAIIGACDVDAPLLGVAGAARGYAAQKGATPRDIDELEDALETFADVVERDLSVDVRAVSGAGAGGGMGAGVIAFFDGELTSGFDLVAARVGLARALDWCDVVVTGEGRIDEQTARGKAPYGVARMAATAGRPCFAVAGKVSLSPDRSAALGFARVVAVDPTLPAAHGVASAVQTLLGPAP